MNDLRATWGIHDGDVSGDSTNQLYPPIIFSAQEDAGRVGDGPSLDLFQAFSVSGLAEGRLDGLPIQWMQSQVSDRCTFPALPRTDVSGPHAFTGSSDAKSDHSSGQGSQSKNSQDLPTENGEPVVPRKRHRATEFHNLTEKKRRERITDGIKTLHGLVPSSRKFDKVSMLDDVIEHIKSLQHQAQVLSLWSGRVQTPLSFSSDAGEHARQLHRHIQGITHPPHKGMCRFRDELHDMNCRSGVPPRISQPQPLVSSAPALQFSPLQMPIRGTVHGSPMGFDVDALSPSFVIQCEASSQAPARSLQTGQATKEESTTVNGGSRP
ncbi:unnamed protein product [Victoria cruziana]